MLTSLLRLADAPLLPFQFVNFAGAVEGYLSELSKLKGASAIHLEKARKELANLAKSAEAYETRYKKAAELASSGSKAQLEIVNEALIRTERAMLSEAGLPGRNWFKNQIYAPGLYTGYDAKTLPGIREAAEAGRWEEAYQQSERLVLTLRAVRSQIQRAEKALSGL